MTFDYSKIKDPGFFRENRLDLRSDHKFFLNETEARENESSFIHCLNGLWKFSYAKNYELAPKGFESPDYDCKRWDDIMVPGHIQLQGYDKPQYVNVQYPWDGHEDISPGEIPEIFNPVASYAKYFTLPEGWDKDDLYISFQGVESGFALWLNGHYVGYSLDSFTPSEFCLSPYVQDGENKLSVQVFKFTAGSWVEDQDFFRFSGIFRDVFLYTVPKLHLWDLKVETQLSKDFSDAVLNLTMQFPDNADGLLEVRLLCDDELAASASMPATKVTQMKLPVKSPLLWSAEKPNLYQLEIRVSDNDGNLQEFIPQNVGFRRFELIDKIMHINGKRIEFYGTNRHEFSCYSGRAITKEQMEYDVRIMKQNNINAVRTSHYPNASYFYELCDKYGLYVIDETNLETHGRWEICQDNEDVSFALPGDNPKWLDIVLDRVDNLYNRDKNHPSVIIWSLGNESLSGKNLLEMAERFRSYDSTRLVHYEGTRWDPRFYECTDIESQMYTAAAEVKEFLKENREKPMILCEYLHTMGNSGGALHKYIELMDYDPLFQGGFTWDFVDQTLLKKDRYGKFFQAYGGDFEDRPSDFEFCGNGILFGDGSPTPQLQTLKFNYQNIVVNVSADKVKVRNKYLFTSTADYDCVVIMEKNGKEIIRKPLETNVGPLSVEEYPLPFALPENTGIYAITVSFRLKADTPWEKAGYEIAFGQYVLDNPAPKPKCAAPFTVIRGGQTFGVRGEHFNAIFARNRGGLVSYKYGGREMIKRIPMPNFWRAPTDNDVANCMPARYAPWKVASQHATHLPYENRYEWDRKLNPTLEVFDDRAEITYVYNLPTTPKSECEVKYVVTGDGTIRVDLTCEPKDLPPMPEFGMMFKLDADYENLEWFGQGPEETYLDRETGSKLGIYSNKVIDNMTKYIVPQECGNKLGVYYAKLTDNLGRGFIFTGDKMEFSALPYTPHEIENAAHHYELPQIHYTVVRANLRQMGIAGDQTWGARTHDEYLLPENKKLSFSFSFKGI